MIGKQEKILYNHFKIHRSLSSSLSPTKTSKNGKLKVIWVYIDESVFKNIN